MIDYNEITTGTTIVFDGDPCKVLSHRVFRMQQRKPVNATKLKNLKTGKVIEHSFHQNDKVDEAELKKESAVFIYQSKEEYIFHKEGNPGARFPLSIDVIGPGARFLKPKEIYQVVYFEDEPIGLEIPIKMSFVVKEAPPAVKGNTATGATKVVTLETGTTVTCPLFINEGDTIEVNTETGDYVSRKEKA